MSAVTAGAEPGRLEQGLQRCDPLADAVAAELGAGVCSWSQIDAVLAGRAAETAALHALGQALWTTPAWVDPERLRLGAEAIQRTGILGGIVLALYSLPLGYRSPTAVKPLVFSGRLVEQAPRRLAETNRFLHAVTLPGGLVSGAPGWAIAARVRVVHAIVRQRLWASGHWRPQDWGAPINQVHLAGTNLLFSLHGIEGLRRLGVRFTQDETQAVLHLWRRVGQHMGIEGEWLCATEADAWWLWRQIEACDGPIDDDGRQLAKALIEQAVPHVLGSLLPGAAGAGGARLVPLLYQLSSALLGPQDAAMLGYPASRGPLVVAPLLRTLVGGMESMRGRSDRRRALMVGLGTAVNRRLADAALGDRPARFDEVA